MTYRGAAPAPTAAASAGEALAGEHAAKEALRGHNEPPGVGGGEGLGRASEPLLEALLEGLRKDVGVLLLLLLLLFFQIACVCLKFRCGARIIHYSPLASPSAPHLNLLPVAPPPFPLRRCRRRRRGPLWLLLAGASGGCGGCGGRGGRRPSRAHASECAVGVSEAGVVVCCMQCNSDRMRRMAWATRDGTGRTYVRTYPGRGRRGAAGRSSRGPESAPLPRGGHPLGASPPRAAGALARRGRARAWGSGPRGSTAPLPAFSR